MVYVTLRLVTYCSPTGAVSQSADPEAGAE
jgi:hypothetical protein